MESANNPVLERGIGIGNPLTALDVAKLTLFQNLITKSRKPWMKWIERKLGKVVKDQEVQDALYRKPTKREKKKNLQNESLAESTLKI